MAHVCVPLWQAKGNKGLLQAQGHCNLIFHQETTGSLGMVLEWLSYFCQHAEKYCIKNCPQGIASLGKCPI